MHGLTESILLHDNSIGLTTCNGTQLTCNRHGSYDDRPQMSLRLGLKTAIQGDVVKRHAWHLKQVANQVKVRATQSV